MKLSQAVAPTTLPVTVWDAMDHLRVTDDDEYSQVSALIERAVAYIDGPYGIGMCVMNQTWDMVQDRFTDPIWIPVYPVQSVTSITYTDVDGVSQTLASDTYTLDGYGMSPAIKRAYNQTWPASRVEPNAVTIRFVAGHESAPMDIKQAVLLLVGHWYENREATGKLDNIPFSVDAILNKYKIAGIS